MATRLLCRQIRQRWPPWLRRRRRSPERRRIELFVIARDIDADPSAIHALRTALWSRRRGGEVCAFLVDGAIRSATPADGLRLIQQLGVAGVRLLADAVSFERLGEAATSLGVAAATEHDLAALLRSPGTLAVWC